MLIFTRKLGESFMIGDEIEVFILESQSDKIRIGINAPKNIQILRKELYDTKKSNTEAVITLNKDKFAALKQSFIKEDQKENDQNP